jgi:hypothetical protein
MSVASQMPGCACGDTAVLGNGVPVAAAFASITTGSSHPASTSVRSKDIRKDNGNERPWRYRVGRILASRAYRVGSRIGCDGHACDAAMRHVVRDPRRYGDGSRCTLRDAGVRDKARSGG